MHDKPLTLTGDDKSHICSHLMGLARYFSVFLKLFLNCSTCMNKEDFGETALMLRLPFAIHKPIMCDPRHLQFHIYELL